MLEDDLDGGGIDGSEAQEEDCDHFTSLVMAQVWLLTPCWSHLWALRESCVGAAHWQRGGGAM